MSGRNRWSSSSSHMARRTGPPAGSARSASSAFRGVEGWPFGDLGLESELDMTYSTIVNKSRAHLSHWLARAGYWGAQRPGLAIALLLGTGTALGAGITLTDNAMLRSKADQQEAVLAVTRRDAQREINALAARMGELQAEANRLNALGERLTRIGQLQDGEFNFDKPVGVGGAGPVRHLSTPELRDGRDTLNRQLAGSGEQLSVIESM